MKAPAISEPKIPGHVMTANVFSAGIAPGHSVLHSYFPLCPEILMRCLGVMVCSLLCAAPLAAQENPFAFTGGSVKSAYITYTITDSSRERPPAPPGKWAWRRIAGS